jgi:hypothetical protein
VPREVDPGEHDAVLRRGLRLGQISREFALLSGLTRHEQVRNFLAMCAQSKVVDAEARIAPRKRKKWRAGAWAIDLVRLSKKKRQRAISCEGSTSPTAPATSARRAGRASISQSRSSVQCLPCVTIFPDPKEFIAR